jgi:hypothetical protein
VCDITRFSITASDICLTRIDQKAVNLEIFENIELGTFPDRQNNSQNMTGRLRKQRRTPMKYGRPQNMLLPFINK